jgi:hypothetical protein
MSIEWVHELIDQKTILMAHWGIEPDFPDSHFAALPLYNTFSLNKQLYIYITGFPMWSNRKCINFEARQNWVLILILTHDSFVTLGKLVNLLSSIFNLKHGDNEVKMKLNIYAEHPASTSYAIDSQ